MKKATRNYAPSAAPGEQNGNDQWGSRIPPNIQKGFTTGLFGHIDSFGSHGASGWVIDLSRPHATLKVTAVVNGLIVGTAHTGAPRPDIGEIIQAPANCSFHLEWEEKQLAEAIADLSGDQICPIEIRPEGETRPIATANLPSVAEVLDWLEGGLVTGCLDRVSSDLIATGWALNPRNDYPARVLIVVDGVVVAEGDANLPHPDLISSNPSQAMSRFQINMPENASYTLESEIEALVDGFPLSGSPRKLDILDQVSLAVTKILHGELHLEVQGWPGQTLDGELHVDGRKAADLSLVASHDTTDRPRTLAGHWTLPTHLVDGQPHVYVFIVRQGNIILRSDASVLSYPRYSVHIDQVSLDKIGGWAFRHDREAPLELIVTRRGQMIKRAVANIERMDVQRVYPNAPARTGFQFAPPSGVLRENFTEFEFADAETGISLARLAVAKPYESLTALAGELADSQSVLRPLLSQLMISNSDVLALSAKILPPPKRAARSETVDVVIPVYGGAIETLECLESVLVAQNKTPARIVVINDNTPDPRIRDYLASLEKRGRDDLVVIHRKNNGGFSQTVNIGMVAAGDHDVILLNADTVVQSGWIDRIVAVADNNSRIGTITPLSNNAEICTIPYICKSLPLRDPALARELDHVAATINHGKFVDIPVAVGFCMYLRRECIDDVGLFDVDTWGRGYGEEVDFCLKAATLGWRHVLAGDTFVVHRGAVSFGNEKLHRIQESAKKISERYPFYDAIIQRFIAADPGAPIRRAINLELIGKTLPQKRILHVTHGFGGGTEQYVNDITAINIETGYTPVILRFMEDGGADLSVNLFDTRLKGFFLDQHNEHYNTHEIEAIKEGITRLGFERLHIHAPFNIPLDFLSWITSTYPVDITIHDYAWICPRVTLTTAGGHYCGEPPVDQCTNCVEFYRPHPGLTHLVDNAGGNVAQYRASLRQIIAKAQTAYVAAEDVVRRMERHGAYGNYKVLPHPVRKGTVYDTQQNLANRSLDCGRINIALFGAIGETKGFHVLYECAENAFRKRLPLHFIVFGYTMNDELCRSLPNIQILGRYNDEDLDDIVRQHRPHLSFFPNQWPETFSYTLSHSFRLGIWPVVTDIGAPAERVRNAKFGSIFDMNSNADTICRILMDQAIAMGGCNANPA